MLTRPGGTLTMLHTDVEESTLLTVHLEDRYPEVLATHRTLVRAAFAALEGHESIDLDYGRDSFEALLRLFHGTKPAYEVDELRGHRVSATLGGDDPDWSGCHVEWLEEDGEVVVSLVSQVGFRQHGETKWTVLTEDALQDATQPLPPGADGGEMRLISKLEEMNERLIAVLTRRNASAK